MGNSADKILLCCAENSENRKEKELLPISLEIESPKPKIKLA